MLLSDTNTIGHKTNVRGNTWNCMYPYSAHDGAGLARDSDAYLSMILLRLNNYTVYAVYYIYVINGYTECVVLCACIQQWGSQLSVKFFNSFFGTIDEIYRAVLFFSYRIDFRPTERYHLLWPAMWE